MEDILLDIRGWNDWMRKRFPKKDIIKLEELLGDYYDLIDEVDDLKDKIRDLEEDIQENYKPIKKAEQYDVEII